MAKNKPYKRAYVEITNLCNLSCSFCHGTKRAPRDMTVKEFRELLPKLLMKSCELEIGGIHNSQLLTVAPTGSISTMIGVSGGIEPIFANSYTRKTQSLHGEDVYYKVYTPIVEHYMKAHDIKEESDLPPEFVVASDIDPMSRIECQAAWQKWIDASISSTINLIPPTADLESITVTF